MMEDARSIVVISNENELSKLYTQLEPVKLHENKGLAIKSIFHGTVCNINKYNNKVHYKLNDETYQTRVIAIPEGNYPDSLSILNEISDIVSTLDTEVTHVKRPRLEITLRARRNSVKVSAFNIDILVPNLRGTPWELLGINTNINESNSVEVDNLDYSHWTMPSFLYVNIVENSYINGKLSRNLSTIPLSLQRGWSYYEFNNPTYIPIDVKEFSKIVIEIRDMNGNHVCFNSNYRTVVTLHLQTINRESNTVSN